MDLGDGQRSAFNIVSVCSQLAHLRICIKIIINVPLIDLPAHGCGQKRMRSSVFRIYISISANITSYRVVQTWLCVVSVCGLRAQCFIYYFCSSGLSVRYGTVNMKNGEKGEKNKVSGFVLQIALEMGIRVILASPATPPTTTK